MALVVEAQERIITLQRGKETVTLKDIPGFSVEELRKFYAGVYPELTTAILDGPKMTQKGAVYHFKTSLGTKG